MAGPRALDQLRQDVIFGLRNLRRQPGFALAAILTLASGIGATTAILSVVNGVMIRPLPYPNASRVLLINTIGRPGSSLAGRDLPFSAANFVDLRRGSKALERVAAFRNWDYTLAENGAAELLAGAKVSAGWFEILGMTPRLGRSFGAADEQWGSEPVAIIGDGLWRRRFGGDRNVVGRSVTLNGQRFTIVGVMPRGFEFPRGAELPSGYQFGARTEIWTPLTFSESELEFRGLQNLAVIGLPKAGQTPAALRADLDLVMGRLAEQFPADNRNLTARTEPLLETAVRTVRPALVLLLGAVAFLLLIACVNVSNLLLTRTASRAREVAVRAALGAGGRRLLRQFVTENLILVTLGGLIGVAVAVAGKGALLGLAPANLPRRSDIAIDWRVLGSAIGLMLVIGAVFGALVAAEAASGNRAERLREGTKGSGGRVTRRLRHGLVVVEVAVSVMLLSGAGILGRTFLNLRHVAPGFRSDGLLTFRVSLPRTTSDFSQFARLVPEWSRFYRNLAARLADRPGVGAVGVATMLPLTGAWESTAFRIEGRQPVDPDEQPTALYAGVSDGYFRAMGIPILKGRGFDQSEYDSTASTVVISAAMARAHWPNEDPIGQRISVFFGRPLEVIGVAGDVRHRDIGSPPIPSMYLPLGLYSSSSMELVVATAGPPLALLPEVKEAVRSIDPAAPLTDVLTVDQILAESIAQQRMSATLIGVFALAALGLAALGLYGVISFGVARRAREIGIRLALGATPRNVLAGVVREGAVMSLIGVGLGVGGALALGRVLSSLVFGVSPTDPVILTVAAALLVAIALVASLLPARRAMRVDPVTALREE